jgi:glycolate oxidase FAD binding subunit
MPHRDPATAVDAATRAWGADAARLAQPGDAIDGQAPLFVLEPDDPRMLAAMLRWADSSRLALVPRGGGTKLTWGALPARFDAVLSTARLTTDIEHCAGDLTATLPAGLTLAVANTVLAAERQWLPLDSLFDERATIGGLLATNDSGPRRHKHGTPRDLVIGVEMALADGRIAKAGGRVVKNVAGYDLARLICGSFGTLAVVTKATFKLAPQPAASRTVAADFPDYQHACAAVPDLADVSLAPSAIEIDVSPRSSSRLLVRFETTPASADRQAAVAAGICGRHGAGTALLHDDDETEAWRTHRDAFASSATLIKLSILPDRLLDTVRRIGAAAADRGVNWRLGGRAAEGVFLLALSGETDPLVAAISTVRAAAGACGGSVVVLAADRTVKARVDPWGPVGGAGAVGDVRSLIRDVKARFDPHCTLSPGRGPGGI